MAEEFQAGICSGSWWNSLRTPTFDYGPAISCPSAITGSIGDDSPGSGSSITFQDTLKMDSTPQVFGLSEWNQPFLPYYQQEGAIEVQPERTQLGFGDSSESLAQEQNQQNCLGLPSAVLQGLLEPVDPFPQFLRAGAAASPKQQLHFSNNTPFWNPSATPVPNQIAMQSFEERPSSSTLTPKRNCERSTRDLSSRLTNKPSIGKNNVSEPAVKKPRIETPSPLPTFKVRKEKLGDRITALQQLVSPFGKTDTASVLHEAIDYIKFLHNQVGSLCNPYLKYNGHQVQQQRSKEDDEPNEDLRSRGLCLVPISSTFAVASEMPLECWNPTFGGSYR